MAKLGTDKKPVVVRVQTVERAQEILDLCHKCGWKVVVGIEPDKPENIDDVKWLLKKRADQPRVVKIAPFKVSPNDYCPCGSGLKYKKCCLLKKT